MVVQVRGNRIFCVQVEKKEKIQGIFRERANRIGG